MQKHWRQLISLLPAKLERRAYEAYFKKEHSRMKAASTGTSSNFTKHTVLREIKNKYRLTTLIETGTYLGDTLYALYNDFESLYSIELSEFYFTQAKKRFSNYPNVHLLHGDSGSVLKELVPRLTAPALFWLDGHYSGGLTAKGEKECPVFEELDAIFNSPYEHVIVIDDARLFDGTHDYPTMEQLAAYVNRIKPRSRMYTAEDSIRLIPAT